MTLANVCLLHHNIEPSKTTLCANVAVMVREAAPYKNYASYTLLARVMQLEPTLSKQE